MQPIDAKMENASSVKISKLLLWKYNSELENLYSSRSARVQYKFWLKQRNYSDVKKIYSLF
jgi:hypothetical protein